MVRDVVPFDLERMELVGNYLILDPWVDYDFYTTWVDLFMEESTAKR